MYPSFSFPCNGAAACSEHFFILKKCRLVPDLYHLANMETPFMYSVHNEYMRNEEV